LRAMRVNLARWFPELADVPFVESWAGMIEASPDILPIICQAEAVAGYFIATGFSGHGFGLGPGAGRAIAEMVSGAAPTFDMAPFRLARFFDGTPLKPGQAM
ncbi:MAG: FAD-binding oxidoreductase, partial [Chloroflexi bacterium]|nr:FAD-binding oxidoreductase [Chloroflexota bacterium]